MLLVRVTKQSLAGLVNPLRNALARLRVPRLGQDQTVLAGATGCTLAFGPGHLLASATPGSPGTTVLSGHRDTHFRFLKDLVPGDRLQLQTPAGEQVYEVIGARVVDTRTTPLTIRGGTPELVLVTRYPPEVVAPTGPHRYLVTAVLLPPAGPQPASAPVLGATYGGDSTRQPSRFSPRLHEFGTIRGDRGGTP